jgi:hypothetical protein
VQETYSEGLPIPAAFITPVISPYTEHQFTKAWHATESYAGTSPRPLAASSAELRMAVIDEKGEEMLMSASVCALEAMMGGSGAMMGGSGAMMGGGGAMMGGNGAMMGGNGAMMVCNGAMMGGTGAMMGGGGAMMDGNRAMMGCNRAMMGGGGEMMVHLGLTPCATLAASATTHLRVALARSTQHKTVSSSSTQSAGTAQSASGRVSGSLHRAPRQMMQRAQR